MRNVKKEKQSIAAVIFDMDGVLADSETLWNDIDGTLLADYGIAYKGEYKHEVLGKGFALALQFYKDAFALDAEIATMAVRRTSIATDYYANRIPMFPAAPEVLAQLKRSGLKIGLASSSVGALVLPFLERCDLLSYFDAIVTGEQVQHGKPNPDIYLKAASNLGVEPAKCLVVEDALSGIQAGLSAGMTVVAIPDPRFMDVTLYPDFANFVIGDLSELPGLVQDRFDIENFIS